MTKVTKPIDIEKVVEKIFRDGQRGPTSVSIDEIKALGHAVIEGNHYLALLDDAAEAHSACSALIATTMLTLKSVEGENPDALVAASQGLSKLNDAFDQFRNLRGTINE